MKKNRKLKNPQIKEAVIEFQFQPHLEFDKDFPNAFRDQLNEEYKFRNFQKCKAFSVSLYEDNVLNTTESTDIFDGIILEDQKRGYVVQLLRDRLSVSKLKPYGNFESLFEEAFKIYKLIQTLLINRNISRIGVRYVNEIEIEYPIKNYLKEASFYLNNLNYGTPERIYQQIIYSNSELEGTILNFVIDNKKKLLIIDIDAYTTQSQNPNDKDSIERVLGNLRSNKNDLFFQIVSDKIEEVI